MTSEFVNKIYTKKCGANSELSFDIHIAYIPNKLIEPRGHTADQQFQKFENFIERIRL